MELVRRLDTGLAEVFPDPNERLRHILTSQIFEMSHNEILHEHHLRGCLRRRRGAQGVDQGLRALQGRRPRTHDHGGAPEDGRRDADGRQLTMSKKFDVVIGNPPYQEEAQGGGTRDTPVYHLFMDAAYEVGKKVVLITPARFLFNARLHAQSVEREDARRPPPERPALRAQQRRSVPGHDSSTAVSQSPTATRTTKASPIGTFTSFPELNTILHKVVEYGMPSLERLGITSSRTYRYTDKLYEDHPEARALRPEGNTALVNTNAFEQFAFLYHSDKPADGNEYVRVFGLDRKDRVPPLDSQRLPHGSGCVRQVQGHRSEGARAPRNTWQRACPSHRSASCWRTSGRCDAVFHHHRLVRRQGRAADACLKYVKSKFARRCSAS